MPYNWDAPFEIRDIRNGEWYWVQKGVLASKKINASDKIVYSSLAYFANNKDQKCYPSYRGIANLLNISKNTVMKSIKALIKHGFISDKKRKGKSSYYKLLKLCVPKNDTPTVPKKRTVPKFGTGCPKLDTTVSQIRPTNNTYLTRLNNNTKKREAQTSKNSLKEKDFKEIAGKYNVPVAFVLSKFDDICSWEDEKPGRMKGRNWRITLMRWVKKDAIQLKKEGNDEFQYNPNVRGDNPPWV